MKFDVKTLPAEYTDLMLLLTKLPFRYEKILIRTYEDEDLMLVRNKDQLKTDAPVAMGGDTFNVQKTKITEDGVWDIFIDYYNLNPDDIKRHSFLETLEQQCERHGYAVVLLSFDCLYLEIMDRVIFQGFSIEGSRELCADFDIDYEEICAEAIRRRLPTYEVLRDRITAQDMKQMYESNTKSSTVPKQPKPDKEPQQMKSVEGVNIFHETLHDER